MHGAASSKHWRPRGRAGVVVALAAAALAGAAVAAPGLAAAAQPATATPIKHLVVVIGENHTFDNVFATYAPPAGQSVWDLRSEGIVTAAGLPGPHVGRAAQWRATDTTKTPGHYTPTPPLVGPYRTLPRPNTTYIESRCDGGQPQNTLDRRFPANLPNAPYQITRYVPYLDLHNGSPRCQTGAYVGDPLHRFYQMWQQVNGGTNRLWVWVHQTAGDWNGQPPGPSTNEGAVSMGFYNVARGDAPVLDYLARHDAMSDNYHQAVQGGTGANHIALGSGDAAAYLRHGRPATPPKLEIENPNPRPGTNNSYLQDGYSGGSYSKCADPSQPGVGPILGLLHSQDYRPFRGGDCAPGTYYLLNNYNPGYNPDGTLAKGKFVVPPQTFRTIADELSAKGISWRYYGQDWRNGHPNPNSYCIICDPFVYATSVMRNPAKRRNLQGFADFERAAAAGRLPAVSFVKPAERYDGHAGYSTLAAFESFAAQVVSDVARRPHMLASTAILITFDEGGGYYDSGYVQPISFFGDGPRVPMIAISPYVRPGAIDHTYADHASVLKFIERNWGLSTLSARSWDNLPDPTSGPTAYVPGNRPAIGDLMSLFDFHHAPRPARRMAHALERAMAPHALHPARR